MALIFEVFWVTNFSIGKPLTIFIFVYLNDIVCSTIRKFFIE